MGEYGLMKAISLWNPYPYFILNGIKHYETRSWKTNYRGKIAIHACKKNDIQIQTIIKELSLLSGKLEDKEQFMKSLENVEYGKIICTADLVNCIEITPNFFKTLSASEKMVGDYRFGRFAWELENIQPIKPIPAKGGQRLWNWNY